MDPRRRQEPPLPGWLGYPVGFLAAVVVVITVGVIAPLWTLWALAVTALALGALATLPAGLASAAFSWGVYAGFVLGRDGELALTGASLRAAGLLAVATVTGFAAAATARWVHARAHTTRAAGVPAPRPPSDADVPARSWRTS